jgi:hypothetical protein
MKQPFRKYIVILSDKKKCHQQAANDKMLSALMAQSQNSLRYVQIMQRKNPDN